jgi:hypothetical protein
METNSRVHKSKFKFSRRQFYILLGYNLPLVLWILFAVSNVFFGFQTLWKCPVDSCFGWCPACGLTRALGLFLTGQDFSNLWLNIILVGFLLNFLWSIRKAITLKPSSPHDRNNCA